MWGLQFAPPPLSPATLLVERKSWRWSLSPLLGSGPLWPLLTARPRWPGLPAASLFQLSSNSWPFILSVFLPGLGQNLPVVQYPTDFSYEGRYLFLIPFNLFYQCAIRQVRRKIMTGKPRADPFCSAPFFPGLHSKHFSLLCLGTSLYHYCIYCC